MHYRIDMQSNGGLATVATHRRRVIINTDAKNEADDQYAIVHALLSPSLDVRGIIPAHFGTWRSDQSMIDSRARGRPAAGADGSEPGQVPVADGAAVPIADERHAGGLAGRPADHRGEPAGHGRRPPVRRFPRAADRHGVRDPARSVDRRPAGDGDLDRRGGPRSISACAGRWSSTSPTTSRPRTWCSTRASRCGRCRAGLPDGVGLLHRAGGEDRRHQRARRLPDPAAEGVERRLPPRSDRVALPG